MISIDPILLDFLDKNAITIGFLLAILKGVAMITPSTTDDKIYTLLSNVFGAFKGNKKELNKK